MSTSTVPASAHIIDWESVAALCRAEWNALVVLAKKHHRIGVVHQRRTELKRLYELWRCSLDDKDVFPELVFRVQMETLAQDAADKATLKTAEWLGEIAKGLLWEDWADDSLAKPIGQAVEALCEAFNSKTQLTLTVCCNESNCGEEGDALNPGDGYLDIGGWLTKSPAAVQFTKDFPAARVNLESWTVYNG